MIISIFDIYFYILYFFVDKNVHSAYMDLDPIEIITNNNNKIVFFYIKINFVISLVWDRVLLTEQNLLRKTNVSVSTNYT